MKDKGLANDNFFENYQDIKFKLRKSKFLVPERAVKAWIANCMIFVRQIGKSTYVNCIKSI